MDYECITSGGAQGDDMSVIEWAERTLTSAGFQVIRAIGGPDRLTFEDESVVGFVRSHDTPSLIIETWLDEQNDFLRQHAAALRQNLRKAWNVYSVFLTFGRASAADARKLTQISEDLVATRKIVADGVVSAEDVTKALAPLLPIRSVGLQRDDVVKRMRDTLRLRPQTLSGLLNEVSLDDMVRLFLDEK
jgi:hypothetical protein